MRPLFLVNPIADRVARQGSLLQVVADMDGVELRLLDTHWMPAPADRVYIEGGDGTAQRVISAYLDSGLPLPQFALVAGGTTNQVAGVIGLRSTTTKGLRKSLHDDLELLAIRLIEVEADGDTHHGFLFSSGAIPQVTDRLAELRGPRGRSGAALVGRAVIAAARPGSRMLSPTEARIIADTGDEHIELRGQHLGTVATTLPSVFAGLDPFWGAGDGALRVTYAEGDASALLPTLLGIWAGRRDARTLRNRGYQSFNAHSLTVRTEAGLVLDGEPIDAGEATLRTTRPVTFVR